MLLAPATGTRPCGKQLRTGPHRFSFADEPNLAEHFAYQQGLLMSLWNRDFANNTGQHTGGGPDPADRLPSGVAARTGGRRQASHIGACDTPFSLRQATSFSSTS
jgi:immune inhibitor A